ncbi:hypothetical protein vseg_018474 [Gypsophila vaccaria]
MSGNSRVKSMNLGENDQRPALVPAENTVITFIEPKKPTSTTIKPHKKVERSPEVNLEKKGSKLVPTLSSPVRKWSSPSSILRGATLSMNGSCSSEASSDSSHSRASTGRVSGGSSVGSGRRKDGVVVVGKVVRVGFDGEEGFDGVVVKKRCAWVTPSNDPAYISFHDDDWGVPVHDDNKLFELLSLSVALAELTWPSILNKRSTFREVFLNFDPVSVSKLNEKKICGPGTPASSLLSELKLRNIFENARQVCKIKNEFGAFDKYIWGFMNHKPIVNKFRYSRQVPVKTSKAEVISKDLVRRGFRGVGPTVVYSFMQVAGLTNDHLITCFRYRECLGALEGIEKDEQATIDVDKPVDLELTRGLDELSISSD